MSHPEAADERRDQPRPVGEQLGPRHEHQDSRARWRRRRRRLWALAGVVFAVFVVVTLVANSAPSTKAPLTAKGGGAAKLFELENVRPAGPAVSLAEHRGTPVVVNFFASWCVPCRREMPGFQAVYEQVRNRVAFVGVNHQDNRRAAIELLEETGVRYPAGFDPEGRVAASYGLFGMPTTLFVSAQGSLLERRTGEMSQKELLAAVERLFSR